VHLSVAVHLAGGGQHEPSPYRSASCSPCSVPSEPARSVRSAGDGTPQGEAAQARWKITSKGARSGSGLVALWGTSSNLEASVRWAMFSRRPVQKLSTHMTAAPGIEQRVARMRSHEPGAAKYDGSVKSRVALTSPTTPSAERCAHCVVRAQAPGGLLVHSCGIRGNPIPGVAAADPLEAGPRELSTAAR
jgi:hypothetical protein